MVGNGLEYVGRSSEVAGKLKLDLALSICPTLCGSESL